MSILMLFTCEQQFLTVLGTFFDPYFLQCDFYYVGVALASNRIYSLCKHIYLASGYRYRFNIKSQKYKKMFYSFFGR